MKRLAFVAAVLAVAACSKSEQATKDTTPAMAPAPAPAAAPDTGMKMGDTTKKMSMDTTKKDTTKKKK